MKNIYCVYKVIKLKIKKLIVFLFLNKIININNFKFLINLFKNKNYE